MLRKIKEFKIIERISLGQTTLCYHGLFYIDYERNQVVTVAIPLNFILVCLRNIWYCIKTFGLVSELGFNRLFTKLHKIKNRI